jgi:hypothetical protein
MALDRQTREGRKPPDQRKLQAEERERVEAAERTRDALRAEAEAEIEQARADKDRAEAELMRDVGRRTATTPTPTRSRADQYARLRAAGYTPDEARRFEATGEATGEDFTLRGEVAPVEDEVDELTLRGEVVPVDEPEATTADNGRELTDEELFEKYRR